MFGKSKKRKLIEYLETEKNSYPEIFENSPDTLLFVMDVKGSIVSLRGRLANLSSGDSQKIVGKKITNYIYKEDKKRVETYFREVIEGKSRYVTYRTVGWNGEITHIDVTLVPIKMEDEVIGLYGLTRNISEKVKLEKGIQETKGQLQSLLNYAHEMIVILNERGTIIYPSPATKSSVGYSHEEIINLNSFDLIHTDDLLDAKIKFADILRRPNIPLTLEARLKHKNGEWRDFEIIATNLLGDPKVKGIVCNLHDITELKRKQIEIQYMANHDYLTKLPNRRAFEERLDLEIRLANADERKFAVLFLNLDGFKILNDSLGHDIGDLLLIEIAKKLQEKLAKSIQMVARIGGDEFAILTAKVFDKSIVEQIANDVLQVFKQPFRIKEYDLFVTSSIGISIFPESGEDSSLLLKNASLALYLAEKAGNNHYQIFSPTADIGTYKMFSLRNDLNRAIVDNQLLLYYQPILHAGTKQIESVEALLRWNHPEWGLISPDEFIPLAEESGLIIQIGEWVIKSVCEKLRLWHGAGYFIKASVNISAVQFLSSDLVDTMANTLKINGLGAKWLNIEVTEASKFDKEMKVFEKIKRLREMGMEIILDNFGTGHSSFRKIKDVQPGILKLDKSFIKEIHHDKYCMEITTAMIQLAHQLSIKVAAEGVETEEQNDILTALGCDFVQGFLFSRPVSEANIEKLLKGQWALEEKNVIFQEKRKYFRVNLQFPLKAMMTVDEINGRKVQVGNTAVLLENIGPGGLHFISGIRLPAATDIILKFQIKLIDEEMTLYGSIIHDAEQGSLFRYGVQFLIDERRRGYLIKYFNQLQLKLKKDPIPAGYPFITENIFTYFKKI